MYYLPLFILLAGIQDLGLGFEGVFLGYDSYQIILYYIFIVFIGFVAFYSCVIHYQYIQHVVSKFNH